jgi:hypothetical protein
MGDRFEIDLGQLPAIVSSLGERARDADGVIDDARSLVSRVQDLAGSCTGVGGDVSLAWTYIDHARTGLFDLQHDVAGRAQMIARSEGHPEIADAVGEALKPPEKHGGVMGWIHIGLDVAGFIPVVGDAADGLNALIYIGEGDWANAAISGVAVIPFVGSAATAGRLGAKAIKIGKDIRHADEVEEAASDIVRGAPTPKPKPGTPEHEAQAWERYQERGGQLPYEQWRNRYRANIENPGKSHQMMDDYRDALKWPDREKTVTSSDGHTRRLDIADVARKRAVEHKTGGQYRSPENLSEIERDAKLVEDGWNIVWVFEKGRPSQPLLDELREAGIPYVIEP